MSTWDSLSPDEREASGKSYDTPTPKDTVDDEDLSDWIWAAEDPDDDISEWLDAMFEDHRFQFGGYE